MNKKSSVQAGSRALRELGLDQLWAEIFQPGSPLAFLTAQGLRIVQPVVSVFTTTVGAASLASLADRLESLPSSKVAASVEEPDE